MRSAAWVVVAALLVAMATVPSAAAAKTPPFEAKIAVGNPTLRCDTGGSGRGRVAVGVTVRYSQVRGKSLAKRRHDVSARVRLFAGKRPAGDWRTADVRVRAGARQARWSGDPAAGGEAVSTARFTLGQVFSPPGGNASGTPAFGDFNAASMAVQTGAFATNSSSWQLALFQQTTN